MVLALLCESIIFFCGNLYPAYRSCKALVNKDVEELKCLMKYWIVFATFTTCTTCCDCLFGWLPFYSGFKIMVFIWILYGNGSRFIYSDFLLPWYIRNEQNINTCATELKKQCYTRMLDLGTQGIGFLRSAAFAMAMRAYNYLRTVEQREWFQQITKNAGERNDDADAQDSNTISINENVINVKRVPDNKKVRGILEWSDDDNIDLESLDENQLLSTDDDDEYDDNNEGSWHQLTKLIQEEKERNNRRILREKGSSPSINCVLMGQNIVEDLTRQAVTESEYKLNRRRHHKS